MLLAGGTAAGGAVEKFGVELGGVKNGSNLTFTTPDPFDPDALRVYANGVRLREGAANDYTITGPNSIQLDWAPLPADYIDADYKVAS